MAEQVFLVGAAEVLPGEGFLRFELLLCGGFYVYAGPLEGLAP